MVAVSSILSLIPLLFEAIGEGILSLAGVIANGGPAIAEAFTVLVLAAVEALVYGCSGSCGWIVCLD